MRRLVDQGVDPLEERNERREAPIANRQLAIYDKRAEVIQTNKMGWLTIWNAAKRMISGLVLK